MPIQGSIPDRKAPVRGGSQDVTFVRADVRNAQSEWTEVQDCLSGEKAVKAKGATYLPVPDAELGGKTTDSRYKSYITRAVFYGVTNRTLQGLVGQVFGRETDIKFPSELEQLVNDVSGDGVGIEQQAKKTLEYVLAFGRAGILTDFPSTGRALSRADVLGGDFHPTIKLYRPENVINWRTRRYGAKVKLSLVVLKEQVDENDDTAFETEVSTVYRVLRLTEDETYTVTLYTEDPEARDEIEYVEGETITPTDSEGKAFDHIPFRFVGPENNDPEIDPAPLAPMASLNLAHYRNSADYEDSTFIAGQPTPVFAGLTEEWVNNVMKGKVYLGSRGGVMLPKGGTADLLQPTMNTMPKEAMDQKEHQMVALGAKLVEDRSIRRTATEARQDEASETSVLSSATKNVNAAYNEGLQDAQKFAGGSGEITFKLNSDFDLTSMTPQERMQLVTEWQSEAISFTEMRRGLRRGRIAFQDDDVAKAEIEENPPMTVPDPASQIPQQTPGEA